MNDPTDEDGRTDDEVPKTGLTDYGPSMTRRGILGSAAAVATLGAGVTTATARDHDEDHDNVDGEEFAPIPETARGPEIPEKGYLVEEFRGGLYWVTDGNYQIMFLVSDEGVIVVDAPPTITGRILDAIEETTDKPITHVVYSHFHADHIAGARLYPDDAEYIAHEQTAQHLDGFDDQFTRNRPDPTTIFEGSYTLEVGDQRLELEYRGANHTWDNIFVYAPDQRVLMFVDVVFPGWAPFKNLALAKDVSGFLEAHDQILSYDFDTLVAGHQTRLGTPEDVRIQREYFEDIRDNTREAIETVDIGPIAQTYSDNPLALFVVYLDTIAERAAESTLEKWLGELGAVDVVTKSHAATIAESLRVDYGLLGPFGLPEGAGRDDGHTQSGGRDRRRREGLDRRRPP